MFYFTIILIIRLCIINNTLLILLFVLAHIIYLQLRSSDNHACQHTRLFFWLEKPSNTHVPTNDTTAFSLFFYFFIIISHILTRLFWQHIFLYAFFNIFLVFFVRPAFMRWAGQFSTCTHNTRIQSVSRKFGNATFELFWW